MIPILLDCPGDLHSAMLRRYDSAACVIELTAKSAIFWGHRKRVDACRPWLRCSAPTNSLFSYATLVPPKGKGRPRLFRPSRGPGPGRL